MEEVTENNIIKNKIQLVNFHKSKSVSDSLNALEFAFINSDPIKLIDNAIQIDSKMRITDLKNRTQTYSLPNKDNILVISVGKASERMLVGFLKKMDESIYRSILIIPKNHIISDHSMELLKKTKIIRSSHPIPNRNSINAANTVIREFKTIDKSKVVVFLISGGSSSLLVKPISGLTLLDKKIVNKLLISCGADIREINTVRKHLSEVKGGKILDSLNFETPVISLILSDVIGDFVDTIGSGLTSYDETTYLDAQKVLKKYSLSNIHLKSIGKVNQILDLGVSFKLPETMKRESSKQRNINNFIIGNNAYFCRYITQYLKDQGYNITYLGSDCNISVKEFAKYSEQIVEKYLKPNSCLLLGGEMVNTLTKKIGVGGRNQEAICFLLDYFKNFKSSDYAVICLGTDGIDGNSLAAGGILSPKTIELIKEKDIEVGYYIKRHDSNTLLSNLNSTIITNYTGTNFNDIYLFIRNE